MSEKLSLNTTFRLTKDHLKLVYVLDNPAKRDVYLLNRLYLTIPDWKMSPDVIYVHFIPETRTVWLNKELADIPSGALITSPVAPYVTAVRAGGRFREEVIIPLPMTEYRQYSGEIQAAPEKSPYEIYREVYFSLGYYWRPEGTTEEETEVHGIPVIIPHPPRATPIEFGTLNSEREQFELNVKLKGGKAN